MSGKAHLLVADSHLLAIFSHGRERERDRQRKSLSHFFL
jgi:hypothetical protein